MSLGLGLGGGEGIEEPRNGEAEGEWKDHDEGEAQWETAASKPGQVSFQIRWQLVKEHGVTVTPYVEYSHVSVTRRRRDLIAGGVQNQPDLRRVGREGKNTIYDGLKYTAHRSINESNPIFNQYHDLGSQVV